MSTPPPRFPTARDRSAPRRRPTCAALVVLVCGAAVGCDELTYVESYVDGTAAGEGLDSPYEMVVSADGAFLYATGADDDAVVTFARNAGSGALTRIETTTGVEGLDGPVALALSPDGRHLYVAAFTASAVITFARNPLTGRLTAVSGVAEGRGGVTGIDGARGVAISPDGAHVYVSGRSANALAVFARDAVTGALTPRQVLRDGEGGVDGLASPHGVIATADGRHVYVAGFWDHSVTVFARNGATGALTYVGMAQADVAGVVGTVGAVDLVTSPDGAQVYAASFLDGAVVVLSRDATTGALAYVESHDGGDDGVFGTKVLTGITASADGAYVYTSAFGDDALGVFARDPATGRLRRTFFLVDEGSGGARLDGPNGVVASPDDRHVYASAILDDAVSLFVRAP